MKFNNPKEKIRIKTFFAWLPIEDRSTHEIRWLEYVTVEQHHDNIGWLNMYFKDNPEGQIN